MDKPKAYYRLLLPSFLLLSACTVDISQPDSSATAVDAEAKTWAVKFQHQSSFTEQSIKEITEPDLKPGDLLFSSSLGVTSFGIRVFSTSSVSHVAIYLGDNNVAEATGAGVQIVSLKKAMKHSDKLFVLRVPDLTPLQPPSYLKADKAFTLSPGQTNKATRLDINPRLQVPNIL